MADRINLNRFKNINFAPNKNIAKTTAAVTLLLSTTACSWSDLSSEGKCIIGAVLIWGGAYALLGIASLFGRGGGGSTPSAPSNY